MPPRPNGNGESSSPQAWSPRRATGKHAQRAPDRRRACWSCSGFARRDTTRSRCSTASTSSCDAGQITALLGAEREREDDAVLDDLRPGAVRAGSITVARRRRVRTRPYRRARAACSSHPNRAASSRTDRRGEPRARFPGAASARPGLRAVPGAPRATSSRAAAFGGEQQMLALAPCWSIRPRSSSPTSRRSGLAPLVVSTIMRVFEELPISGTWCCLSRRRRATCSRSRSRWRSWSSVVWCGSGARGEIDDERLLATYLGAGRSRPTHVSRRRRRLFVHFDAELGEWVSALSALQRGDDHLRLDLHAAALGGNDTRVRLAPAPST